MFKAFSTWFWNPKFWLPPGTDWDELAKYKGVRVYEDIYTYTIPIAFVFILVRFMLDRLVFERAGKAFKLDERKAPFVTKNDYLEEHYQKRTPIELVLKKTDLPRNQVLQWFRKRKQSDKPSVMYKFKESCWRACCYIFLTIVGVCTVYGTPWLRDTKECWRKYPYHEVTTGMWWHYMLSTGFYISLLMTITVDTKRKDSKQMFIHHLTTLGLLVFSWANNMTRNGTLVLLVHDIADPFLEIAKIFNYIKYEKLCDFFFRTFAVAFAVTRLFLFPVFILKSSLYDSAVILPWFDVYYFLNSLMVTLQVLHIYWAYLIYKVAVKANKSGKVEDSRSSSESSDED